MSVLTGTVQGIGLVFGLGTAAAAFARPERFAASLGLTAAGADGRCEVRAQYGGFFLAVAAAQAAALAGAVPSEAALLVLATTFGGLIAGRLGSLVLERRFANYGPVIQGLFAIDAAGLTLSLLALRASNA